MNPWLQIPASDYEDHMSLPEVAQAQALNRLMEAALKEHAPESVAVIGCTTGNGFEHIDPSLTRRVVGVDINPAYLTVLKERFAQKIPGLELIQADVAASGFRIDPVSMVIAGLVFEYVDVAAALNNICRSVVPGGILLAVLQLPSPDSAPVTATPYRSLERLAPIMKLVPPSTFAGLCRRVGLQQIKTDTIPLKKGKAFFAGYYKMNTESGTPADAARRPD